MAVTAPQVRLSILFLDDSPVRTMLFRTKYPEAVCVTTSQSCIAMLTHRSFDLVCLDHDLIDEDAGMVVVEWMVAYIPDIRHIVVHSTNLPAALAMVQMLRAAGYHTEYVPFRYDAGGPFRF